MRKISSIFITLSFILGFIAIVPASISPIDYASAGTNHWFVGVTSQNAADASAWLPATVPSTGDDIYFSALSINNCNWNLAGSFGTFNLLVNFTKTVTQAASFTINSYSQSSGTLTPSSVYTITDIGSFTHTAGTISPSLLCLIMQTDGTAISFGATGFNSGLDLTINGNVAYTATSSWQNPRNFVLATGKTFTINSVFNQAVYNYGTFSNLGTITGAGTFIFQGYGQTQPTITMTLGIINCPVVVKTISVSNPSVTVTLGANTIFGSTLMVESDSTTYTMTLDLSSSNYALTSNRITINTRGIINGRASQITDSGNWDSSAGTFTQGTSSVHLTGVSKTLKVNGGMFQNLFVDSGASYTLQSNVKTYNYWNNGTVTKNGYTLTVNNNQAPSFTSNPVIQVYTNRAYYYNSTTYDREADTVSYTLISNLSRLTVGSSTGKITGNSHYIRASYHIQLYVSDGNHSVCQDYTLTVIWAVTFTSTARTNGYENMWYFYYSSTNITAMWAMNTNATWLSFSPSNNLIYGNIPTIASAHSYWVNLTVTVANGFNWQNYTIIISPEFNSTDYMNTQYQSISYLIILIVIAMCMMIIGIIITFSKATKNGK